MTPRAKKESPMPQSPSAECTARLLEYLAVVLAGVVITLRPILPGHVLSSSTNLLLHAPVMVALFLQMAAQSLRGRIRIVRSGIGIPLIAYALIIGLSPLTAAYKYASLRAVPIWLTNLLLFFIVFNLSRDRRARRFFVAVLLATATVVIFQGVYQRAEGLEELRRLAEKEGFLESFDSSTDIELARARLEGNEPFASFTTANILATFLLITIPVFFGAGMEALRRSTGRRERSDFRPSHTFPPTGGITVACAAVLFFSGFAGLACLYFTGSIAGWVVLVAEVVIFILILCRRWIVRHWQVCAAIAAVLVLALAMFVSPVVRRITGVRSVNYRLGYWAGGLGVFKEHWLTGVGLENFRWSYTRHKPPWAGEVMYPHNSIIQSAAEFGIFGLVAFVAVWILFLVRILRGKVSKEADVPPEKGPPEIMGRRRLFFAGGVMLVALFAVMMWYQPFAGFNGIPSKGMLLVVLVALLWALVFGVCAFGGLGGEGRFLHVALATGALGFLLHSLFDFGIYSYGVNQSCWVVAALALATTAGGVKVTKDKCLSSPARLAITLTGCVWLCFYTFGPIALALHEDAALARVSNEKTGLLVSGEQVPDLDLCDAETLRRLAWKYFQKYRELRSVGGRKDIRIAETGIQRMRDAIRLNPNYFRLRIETAIMLREMGRKPEALEEYDRAVELYPTRPSLRVYRAELLDRMGREEDVRCDLKEVARLLRLNRMPDGSVRHKTLELDTVKGLHGVGSEKEIYDALRAKYHKSNNTYGGG